MALAFAEPGNSVVVHGSKNVEGLRDCERAVVTRGAECLSIQSDLSSDHARAELVERAFAWKGRVDVWINAAGADVLTGEGKELSFDDKLDRLWQVDVKGTIQMSRDVAERMIRQDRGVTLPTIINISWDQSELGMEGDSGQYFSATKAAIAAFSRSLAKTVGPNVRVNCIAPGWIQTAWGKSASPEWDRRARSESILQRWGTVDDIAQTAVFLADKRSEFINGQVIHVNGGRAENQEPGAVSKSDKKE
jgi:3-oxoacyl-[acyl-carrier protein] reductase